MKAVFIGTAFLSLYVPTWVLAQDATLLSFPSPPPNTNHVASNFLGVSIELSTINLIIGETPTSIPQPALNLFSNVRQRMGDSASFPIRVGGNSMDSSIYVQNQTSIMLTRISNTSNVNDLSVYFGPLLFQVLKPFGQQIGGGNYVLGLSLRDPKDPDVIQLASAAEQGLGDDLNVFLLGNEPDLYTSHGNRPGLQNYTTDDYISEWGSVVNSLHDSPYGNLIPNPVLGGPTICCGAWDLKALLDSGYLSNFTNVLKYISVQHYPQNFCFGSYAHGLDLYTQHPQVTQLAQWDVQGVQTARDANLPVMMSEFNTASCGGIPGISNTFASTLWIVDYALQLASVGYNAAYVHTREPGVSYNLFDPPTSPSNNSWRVLPSYYSLLPVAEALRSTSGNASTVVYDLNIANSVTTNGSLSGYALYQDSKPTRLVLFNRPEGNATTAADFALNSSTFTVPSGGNIGVKYLAAPSLYEEEDISWGGETLAGTGDGVMVNATSPTASSYSKMDVPCASGCTIRVPGPGLAVVWLDSALPTSVSSSSAPSGSQATPTGRQPNSGMNHPYRYTFAIASLLVGWFIA